MKEKIKQKLIGKMDEVSEELAGDSMYFRPFERDEQIITQIARACGEKKSAIVQKLVHLALHNQSFEFADEKRYGEKLDWLITHGKREGVRADVSDQRIDRLEEHQKAMEKTLRTVAADAAFTRVLAAEIYCLSSVCMSYLNQIFTKIIEYLSPVEIEKKNSTDFANRNILGLIEHSLAEVEKLTEHYSFDSENVESERLYIFTKIEKIKTRLLTNSVEQNGTQNQKP